jgi:long-chain acyl-CoA synthetase
LAQAMSWDQAMAVLTGPGAPFEIVERLVDGHPIKQFSDLPRSMREAFALARLHGDKPFLVYEDETWTFATLMARVDEIADALVHRYAIRPGDRVAIAMRNYPEWIASFAAILSVGGIAVCMNAWWKAEELAYGLDDSGARLLIADLERFEVAKPRVASGGLRALVVRHDGPLPTGVERLEDVLRPGAAMPEVDVHSHQDATILYTSGTTGFPKGAVSTHHAVLSALRAFACRAIAGAMTQPPKEPSPYPPCFILVVPLFHVTGLVPVMLSSFLNGFKLVMMYKWSPERALELIERERVTQFVGVPTMAFDLLESKDFPLRDTSSLASVGGGGAPAPPELVARIDKSFSRARPGLGYGMTETNAYGPQNSGDDYLRKPRSAGRTVPVVEVRAFDEAMHPLPPGQVGELCFRGPNLIRGYWNKPEATAQTIVHGWLKSGRPRARRRRGVRLRRGSCEGHGASRRREHLLRRSRGGDLRVSGGPRGGGLRRPARAARRGGRLRGASEAGTHDRRRGAADVRRGAPRELQGSDDRRDRRRAAAEERGGEDLEAGAARRARRAAKGRLTAGPEPGAPSSSNRSCPTTGSR